MRSGAVPIERVVVSAYRIPTDFPEADGTFEWNSTTLVVGEITAGGSTSLGYTHADTATARLSHDPLADGIGELCPKVKTATTVAGYIMQESNLLGGSPSFRAKPHWGMQRYGCVRV